VTLRKVPAAVALGLLASLAAHAAIFGGEHSVGGAYHALLVQAAFAGSVGLLVALASLAWAGARYVSDGSILAARLASRLPGFGWIAASGALWLGLAEGIEPHHAGALPLAVPVVLAAAAWAMGRLCRLALALISTVVVVVSKTAFAPRTPPWIRHAFARPLPRRRIFARRRFARPPPIATALRA